MIMFHDFEHAINFNLRGSRESVYTCVGEQKDSHLLRKLLTHSPSEMFPDPLNLPLFYIFIFTKNANISGAPNKNNLGLKL